MEFFLSGLAVLIVLAAAYAVFARGSFAACIGFVVCGLLLALGWMGLFAPDVAITEAAVGGGVTGAVLLGACSRLGMGEAVRPGVWIRWPAAVLCTTLTGGLIAVVLLLPESAPTLAPETLEPLASTGLGNPVTAVLMAYRALDTMFEKVVLLLALVAVWSLARDEAWGGRPDFRFPAQPGGPLDFLARILIPVGVPVGIYIFWVGADEPGGAFAGGAVLSAMGLLALFAGLGTTPAVGSTRLRVALVAGIGVFLAVGMAGLGWTGKFLAYPDAIAKPIIVAIEVAMTLSIAVTLALLVAGPPAEKP